MAGKPNQNPKETQKQQIARLKNEFIAYYKELPIKKAGADFIGRTIDTINDWEAKDTEFADRVLKAKSEYARKHGKGRPDNLLPKLYDDFKPQQSDVVIPTTVVVNYVNPPDQPSADPQAAPGVALPDGQPDH